MPPTNLSQILRGTRNLPQKNVLDFAVKMNLNPSETEYFMMLVQHEDSQNPGVRAFTSKRLRELRPSFEGSTIEANRFHPISKWYYFPILEMVRTEQGQLSPEIIQRRLGIRVSEARKALKDLVQAGFLEVQLEGRYAKTTPRLRATSSLPSEGLRNFHEEMLDKARQSLGTQSPQEKIVASQTLPINPKRLAEAEQITKEYFNRMFELSKDSGESMEVYHLGLQFFRLTHPKDGAEKTVSP